MDPQDFDPIDKLNRPEMQHAASAETQTSGAGQDDFEQHLAQAKQAAPAPILYPHLSAEDRDLIDRAIAQYVDRNSPQQNTVRVIAQAVSRLVNDLRARGQATDLADHKRLGEHADTYFRNDRQMKTGINILRAYHDSSYSVSRGKRARQAPDGGHQPRNKPSSALATRNPSEAALIAQERDAGQSSAAKRPRTLSDLQTVVVYRQSSGIADSGGSGGVSRVTSTGVVIRGMADQRPLYPDDAHNIVGLEEALIHGGMATQSARQHANTLIGFSRWLFEKNKPGIVDRMDSRSLSDGGDIHQYTQDRHKKVLLSALEHLRAFRTSGAAIVHRGRAFARRSPPRQNVAGIGVEGAAPVEPSRTGSDPAQLMARHESHNPRELQEDQQDRGAPPAFLQSLVTSDLEEPPSDQIRQVEDDLGDQLIPSPIHASLEELERLHSELHRVEDNPPTLSLPIDIAEPPFSSERFSPGASRPLLNGANAEQLQGAREDHPLALTQEQMALDSEHLPAADLRRVLDHLYDLSSPPPISVSEEQLRKGAEDLHHLLLHGAAEAPGVREDQPSAFIEEPIAFDSEHLPPADLRRVLDHLYDQSSSPRVSVSEEQLRRGEDELHHLMLHGSVEVQGAREDQLSAFIQEPVAFDYLHLPQADVRRVLDHLYDQTSPSLVSEEALRKREEDLQTLVRGPADDFLGSSVSNNPEEFPSDPKEFLELRRLLDD
ncbi:hypothetical protein [Bradyrhizobium sp. SBR1B]|uniref:hypothetical protein n=1 Tax=Bradyrhizobium sp. SBR1B TaxID=2663836 RepID=UPI0016069AC9|nr:hypothetical protein [Bradyrhizobium sp. SBR1B]MBB4380264.1 hypothetical protein [Bradyrhizobium sp. SBR1B]